MVQPSFDWGDTCDTERVWEGRTTNQCHSGVTPISTGQALSSDRVTGVTPATCRRLSLATPPARGPRAAGDVTGDQVTVSRRVMAGTSGSAHVNRNHLFVEALEELDRLVSKPQSQVSEFELLRVSALLRQLILDAQPLYVQVNRQFQIKVAFRSAYPASLTEQDLPEPPFEGANTPFPVGTKTLSRDDFIRRYAGYIAPNSYTVKDLILYGANVAGGVHAGDPKNPEHITLRDGADMVRIFEKEAALLELLGIGQIVVRSLATLYKLVQADIAKGAKPGSH
jgi:hypothetical protein